MPLWIFSFFFVDKNFATKLNNLVNYFTCAFIILLVKRDIRWQDRNDTEIDIQSAVNGDRWKSVISMVVCSTRLVLDFLLEMFVHTWKKYQSMKYVSGGGECVDCYVCLITISYACLGCMAHGKKFVSWSRFLLKIGKISLFQEMVESSSVEIPKCPSWSILGKHSAVT